MKLVIVLTMLAGVASADSGLARQVQAQQLQAQPADVPIVGGVRSRSWDFQLTKECSTFTGQAGDHSRSLPRTSRQSSSARDSSTYRVLSMACWTVTSFSTRRGPATIRLWAIADSTWRPVSDDARSPAGRGRSPGSRRSADVSCPAAEAPNCTVEGNLQLHPGPMTHTRPCNITPRDGPLQGGPFVTLCFGGSGTPPSGGGGRSKARQQLRNVVPR